LREAGSAADARTLSRIAGWLALGYFLTVAGLQFWDLIREGEADLFLLSLFVIPWLASPIAIAAVLAGASPTRLGAGIFLLLELGLILSIILVFVDGAFIHPSSTAGIALLVWPLIQLIAIIAVAVVASLFGWRIRPDFLKNESPVTPPPRA